MWPPRPAPDDRPQLHIPIRTCDHGRARGPDGFPEAVIRNDVVVGIDTGRDWATMATWMGGGRKPVGAARRTTAGIGVPQLWQEAGMSQFRGKTGRSPGRGFDALRWQTRSGRGRQARGLAPVAYLFLSILPWNCRSRFRSDSQRTSGRSPTTRTDAPLLVCRGVSTVGSCRKSQIDSEEYGKTGKNSCRRSELLIDIQQNPVEN